MFEVWKEIWNDRVTRELIILVLGFFGLLGLILAICIFL